MTPLHQSALVGDIQTVRTLIAKRANLEARAEIGRTPLHSAANAEVAQAIIEAGVDVEAQDGNGRTPLHSAANAEVAQALINARANLEARDENGDTPLDYARKEGNRQITVVLSTARAGSRQRWLTT